MDMGVRQAPMALTSHKALPNRSGWLRCGEGSVVRPNKPLELTPLRGLEITAILKVGTHLTAFPLYQCGATQRQGVGPQPCELHLQFIVYGKLS
jgi:hypothetical protein